MTSNYDSIEKYKSHLKKTQDFSNALVSTKNKHWSFFYYKNNVDRGDMITLKQDVINNDWTSGSGVKHALNCFVDLLLMKCKYFYSIRIDSGIKEFKNKKFSVFALVKIIKSDFYEMFLSNFKLQKSYLRNCSFSNNEFIDVFFREVYLKEVYCSRSYFLQSKFINIDLKETSLKNCIFENCVFANIDFSDCDFEEVKFINCSFLNIKYGRYSFKAIEFIDCVFDFAYPIHCDEVHFFNVRVEESLNPVYSLEKLSDKVLQESGNWRGL